MDPSIINPRLAFYVMHLISQSPSVIGNIGLPSLETKLHALEESLSHEMIRQTNNFITSLTAEERVTLDFEASDFVESEVAAPN